MEIVQHPVQFPAVTVCNTDFLDLEVSDYLGQYISDPEKEYDEAAMGAEITTFIREYMEYSGKAITLMPIYQNMHKGNSAKLREDMGEITNRLALVANMGEDTATHGSVRLSNFIAQCRFMNDVCNANESFRTIFDPYYFNCFTFLPETIMTSSRATRLQGVEYGLTLLLFTSSADQPTVESETFAEGEGAQGIIYLPGLQESDSALASGQGVRLVIHAPGTRPHPTADGYDIPPGKSVTIGVKARENVRIRQPHGNCTDVTDLDPRKAMQWKQPTSNGLWKPEYRYTLMDCQNECIQKVIMKTCDCVDIQLNKANNPRNLPYCFTAPTFSQACTDNVYQAVMMNNMTLLDEDCIDIIKAFEEQMECRKNVYENMTIKFPDRMSKCECYPPCNDIIYDASYSLSTMPERTVSAHASFYAKSREFLDTMPQRQKDLLNASYGPDYKDKLLERVSRLNVHISDSNIIKTTESPDYEAIRLVSDIGGQLGLWIGISVMTIFEVLQLVADIFRFLTAKGKHAGEQRTRLTDGELRNNRLGNGDQRFIRPSLLDNEICEIDKLTTV